MIDPGLDGMERRDRRLIRGQISQNCYLTPCFVREISWFLELASRRTAILSRPEEH